MPSESFPELIRWFHNRGVASAWAITGGGAGAIAALFQVPGASAGVCEVQVPYSTAALREYLGGVPERACSPETARALAVHAADRARRLTGTNPDRHIWGIGLTAALVSNRPKRGEHRAHWAVQGDDFTFDATLRLEKGARNRAEEDAVVSQALLATVLPIGATRSADVPSGVASSTLWSSPPPGQIRTGALTANEIPAAGLVAGETIDYVWATSAPVLAELRNTGRSPVWFRTPHLIVPAHEIDLRGLLCGSFNPLHQGHRELRRVAESRLGGTVGYELSIRNVAKPPLDYLTIADRLAQFDDAPVVVSSAATFAEKSGCFPGITFVIGEDTFVRVLDPRYHGGTWDGVAHALRTIQGNACRFLVAGRDSGSGFQTLAGQAIPVEFAELFDGLTESEFRVDASSTRLRQRRNPLYPAD
jgi:hypothetical protein